MSIFIMNEFAKLKDKDKRIEPSENFMKVAKGRKNWFAYKQGLLVSFELVTLIMHA